MANIKSAKKRVLTSESRRQRNMPYRTMARSSVKRAEEAIAEGDVEAAASAVGDAISTLDRVANRGVIHANNASRRKSRLMAKYNAMGS